MTYQDHTPFNAPTMPVEAFSGPSPTSLPSNPDIVRQLAQMKLAADADSHGGMMHFIRSKMVEMGFFDTMPESSLDPFRPCPSDWTACQIAIFDNGVPAKPKRKRSYIERTKVQHGGQIAIWTRDTINFKMKSQIAWKANIYLWEPDTAPTVANELLQQGYIDQATNELVKEIIDGLTEVAKADEVAMSWKIAIPVLRTTEGGTRWMKDHIVAVEFIDGKPARMLFRGPEISVSSDSWSEQDASGKDLATNVLAQMRLGRHAGFDSWSTQPSSKNA